MSGLDSLHGEIVMRSTTSNTFLTLLWAIAVQLGLAAVSPALAGIPGSTSQLNLDVHGVALGGYDPVAFFDTGKPTRGSEKISASYGGARYLFATAAHRSAAGTITKAEANWPTVKDKAL